MFSETKTVWRQLKQARKPIVMYGMGDGADKILKIMESYGIKPDAFMASDEFVRGHSFRGYEVKKLSDIESTYPDFIIVICFGTSRGDVIERIRELSERYEVYAPDVPVYGEGLFDEEYIAKNIKRIVEVRELFTDELSKNIFDRLIDFRISGKVDILDDCTTPRKEAMALLDIKPNDKEVFLDLGAYDGDTVEEFLTLTSKTFDKIIAVEPDTRNFSKLRRRNYALGSAKFIPINAAVWDSDGVMSFSDKGGRHSSAGGGKRMREVETRSIDSLCKGLKPTLIKLDVEGSEEEALRGAAATIKAAKPKLIVSLYHRTDDLLKLPLLVQELSGGGYKMFLRHHPYIPAWDTNLYCI